MNTQPFVLDLEVTEVESILQRGCINSSSTNPRCTCIPVTPAEDDND